MLCSLRVKWEAFNTAELVCDLDGALQWWSPLLELRSSMERFCCLVLGMHLGKRHQEEGTRAEVTPMAPATHARSKPGHLCPRTSFLHIDANTCMQLNVVNVGLDWLCRLNLSHLPCKRGSGSPAGVGLKGPSSARGWGQKSGLPCDPLCRGGGGWGGCQPQRGGFNQQFCVSASWITKSQCLSSSHKEGSNAAQHRLPTSVTPWHQMQLVNGWQSCRERPAVLLVGLPPHVGALHPFVGAEWWAAQLLATTLPSRMLAMAFCQRGGETPSLHCREY